MKHERKTSLWQAIDWITVLLYMLLVTAGWLSICGACYEFEGTNIFDPSGRPMSQLLWIGISFVAIFVVMMLESDLVESISFLIYALLIVILVATIFFAPDIKGSRSWLAIGSLRLQPAEFAKCTTALALARYMSISGFTLKKTKNFIITLAIFLLPLLCIILQKETGSALVYFAFFLVLYREGMTGLILGLGICAILYFVVGMRYSDISLAEHTPMGEFVVQCIILTLSSVLFVLLSKRLKQFYIMMGIAALSFGIAFVLSPYITINYVWISLGLLTLLVLFLFYRALTQWTVKYALIAIFILGSLSFLYSVDYVFNKVLQPHQQVRIMVSLGLKNDPNGAGYNVKQSKIAIGSGQLWGKGFLNGTQTKLKYVPEQDTDFIFCTVGEEQGFAGSSVVIILFSIFIARLFFLAERQKNSFNRIYGYSVASIFLFHVFINIGMVTGLTPVIGIPLPFFSYGGSSLLGFTLLLFIFLRQDATNTMRNT